MIQIIKETGIFIIAAEAMVYLAPSEIYAKYIKLIVGMVLIARLALPVLTFISGDGIQLYPALFDGYEERAEREEKEDKSEKNRDERENAIQWEMAQELKKRLEHTEGDIQIQDVKFKEREDGSLYLLIVVENQEEEKNGLSKLRQYFAERLQMEMADVEVEMSNGDERKADRIF